MCTVYSCIYLAMLPFLLYRFPLHSIWALTSCIGLPLPHDGLLTQLGFQHFMSGCMSECENILHSSHRSTFHFGTPLTDIYPSHFAQALAFTTWTTFRIQLPDGLKLGSLPLDSLVFTLPSIPIWMNIIIMVSSDIPCWSIPHKAPSSQLSGSGSLFRCINHIHSPPHTQWIVYICASINKYRT